MRPKPCQAHNDFVTGRPGDGGHPLGTATNLGPKKKGIIVKTGNGRGEDGGGWALAKKFIELAKRTNVVTVSPEQRARLLEWARRQTLSEGSGQPLLDASEERRAAHRQAGSRAGQPPPLAASRRATPRRRATGHLLMPRATAAR